MRCIPGAMSFFPTGKKSEIPFENEAATPCPGRFSPNPVVLRLIDKFSAILTGLIVQFRPPGQKMKTIPPPPPPTNIADFSS
jgi:hypothetical protein